MVVGTVRIELALHGIDSLKGKRSIVKRVIDRVRAKFNASVAEIADMDSHRRAVLGVVVVSNDARHANSMVDTIADFVAESSEAPISSRTTELVHVGND